MSERPPRASAPQTAVRRAICLLIFAVTLIALLVAADRLLRRDDGARKYGPFFQNRQEDAYDVLFFGTSHVLNGVLPMELWRDYGVTAYNMANNSEPLEVTKWVLQMALEYHQPKVAVFDVFYIDRAVDLQWTYAFRHLFLDEIPLSPIKVRAVCSTLPRQSWAEFLLPFVLYHGRWDELITGDVVKQVESVPALMGAELRALRAVPQAYERTREAYDGELPGAQALRDIAAICRENGIEPVFICIPSPATREEQMNCNAVYALADELGVPFVNMLDEEGLVDFETDCCDSFSHLNPDGAIKVTRFLGAYLSERFGLADHRGDSGYGDWDARLAEYDAILDAQWGATTLLKAPN